MALAVDAHHRAFIVDHRQAVIMVRPVRLEEAGRDVDAELGRQLPHRQHGGMGIEGLTNLDRIKGRRVRFAALPLPIPGASGCPVRAVAWVDR